MSEVRYVTDRSHVDAKVKMFIRRGCTLYNVHCTNVYSKHSVRLLPVSSIGSGRTKKSSNFWESSADFQTKFLPEFLHLTYLAHCRRVTRPVVNDMFGKISFPSASQTFSFSPRLIFFPTFELFGRIFCHVATVQCTHLTIVQCTLVFPIDAEVLKKLDLASLADPAKVQLSKVRFGLSRISWTRSPR
jgi:hypothetical protein